MLLEEIHINDAKKIIAYVGGSADNTSTTDQCGWGYTLYMSEDAEVGTDIMETSVRMEMHAAINALRAITDKSVPTEIRMNNKVLAEMMQGDKPYNRKKNIKLWEEFDKEKKLFTEGTLIFKHISNDIGDICLKEVHKKAKDEAKNNGGLNNRLQASSANLLS